MKDNVGEDRCPRCRGNGKVEYRDSFGVLFDDVKCQKCNGTGKIKKGNHSNQGGEMLTLKQKQIHNALAVKERKAIIMMDKPMIQRNRRAWHWWAGYKQAMTEAEDICIRPNLKEQTNDNTSTH